MANEITAENEVSRSPQRVMIVTSPKAGAGTGRDQLPKLVERLLSVGIEATVTHSLTDLRHFSDRARSQTLGTHLVVAAGGDGTLSLVAEHVFPEMPLVPMPMGTENLLARQFGYSVDAHHVFETITKGDSYWLDAGLANGKLFLVMASCGFDAEVVRALHLRRKGHINRLSYTKPIIRALRRYHFPALRVEVTAGDSGKSSEYVRQFECRWAMVFNLPKYGGDLSIEPDAIGNDGQLDAIMFQNGSLLSGIRYVAGIKTGRHLGFRDVVRYSAPGFCISSDARVPYQLDGDYVGRLPLKIETLPGRIHLRIPMDSGGKGHHDPSPGRPPNDR